jgi:hypothetical protein
VNARLTTPSSSTYVLPTWCWKNTSAKSPPLESASPIACRISVSVTPKRAK